MNWLIRFKTGATVWLSMEKPKESYPLIKCSNSYGSFCLNTKTNLSSHLKPFLAKLQLQNTLKKPNSTKKPRAKSSTLLMDML